MKNKNIYQMKKSNILNKISILFGFILSSLILSNGAMGNFDPEKMVDHQDTNKTVDLKSKEQKNVTNDNEEIQPEPEEGP